MTDAQRAAFIEGMIKMELVTKTNRLKLCWYVLIGRAISIGYLVLPYKEIEYAQKDKREAKY
jgi:hypothetical protein